MPRIFVIALPLLLSACNAGGGQSGLALGYGDMDEQLHQLRIVSSQHCKGLGLRPDTLPFEECVHRYGREKIEEAELSLAASGSMVPASPIYSAPPAVYAPSPPPPRAPVMCRTMPTSANDSVTYCN
jgi:hypothetical protein